LISNDVYDDVQEIWTCDTCDDSNACDDLSGACVNGADRDHDSDRDYYDDVWLMLSGANGADDGYYGVVMTNCFCVSNVTLNEISNDVYDDYLTLFLGLNLFPKFDLLGFQLSSVSNYPCLR
jgi:hypothetical protein